MRVTKKDAFSVRIPKDLNEKLNEHVAKRGISKSGFICNLVYKELEDKPAPAKQYKAQKKG